jgi:predicted secreted protein
MILKGQNFRVFLKDGNTYKVVAKSTSCTISRTSNTQELNTKDDVGGAAKPSITSKAWSVQVESLNVTDIASILTAMKSGTPFDLAWDEVGTSDNQTPTGESACNGKAFLNDLVANFNNNEFSTKTIQFTGTGGITNEEFTGTVIAVDDNYTKGQFVRLFLAANNSTTPSDVVSAASQLSLHVSVTLENASTKDTTTNWVVNEQTGYTFDISTTAMVKSDEVITSSVDGKSYNDLCDIFHAAQPVKFQIANVSGANNRTKGSVIISGSVIVASIENQNPNRANATYSATLNGYGAYTVGA